jgi:DNA replication and repair protein RecF
VIQRAASRTDPIATVDASAAPVLAVLRLGVSEFRSYAQAEIECGPDSIVLTGPNGAGKTNLLEAVSFLAPGRGLRRARLAEVERHGAARRWAVNATVSGPVGPLSIGTGRDPDSGEDSDRRVVRIDGVNQRGPVSLAEHVAVSWLTPAMDRLFADGSSGRRRFIDRLVLGFDPEHARRVGAFEQAMRERGRLLEAGSSDPGWLSALEATMASEGVAVAAARKTLVDRLAVLAEEGETMSAGAFPVPSMAMAGELAGWLDAMPALEAEERLAASLAQSRRRDAESGGAAFGPQRDDFVVVYRAKDVPARQCSTGEQKALLIAIVLAHARLVAAERGRAPLLLLDEIAAHLDPARRQALFREIGRIGVQAWMTGTDEMLFAPLTGRARFFRVAEGRVQPR